MIEEVERPTLQKHGPVKSETTIAIERTLNTGKAVRLMPRDGQSIEQLRATTNGKFRRRKDVRIKTMRTVDGAIIAWLEKKDV